MRPRLPVQLGDVRLTRSAIVAALVVTAACGSNESATPAATARPSQAPPAPPSDPFERALDDSGTRARLASVGLSVRTETEVPPPEDVGASRAVRLRSADGTATADVYYFESAESHERGRALLAARASPESGAARVSANGAFVVVIVTTGPGAEANATRIASTVAGEE